MEERGREVKEVKGRIEGKRRNEETSGELRKEVERQMRIGEARRGEKREEVKTR